jgi:serine/threonine protein kinase/tetratricopeptide (TPR) repeat protein
MDTELNLLFGVVAFQNGAVDGDRLAESCAAWVTEPTIPLADLFVDRGWMTNEQRTELESLVARELEVYGGNAQATLIASMDGRALSVIQGAGGVKNVLEAKLNLPSPQDQRSHVVLGTISSGDESTERYTLTHLHAKGGMGRVWLARDSALGRQIALKELRPDQADNSIVCSRFLYEAKITAQLEHPGIVPVYELGERGAPYYTMRFVRGRTLCEAIRAYHKKRTAGEADQVQWAELLTAFSQVCNAVAYAHSQGVIHRDLKGQNIVLGEFGEVMVLDWGLAKRVGPDQQKLGSGPDVATPSSTPDLSMPRHDLDFRYLPTDGAAPVDDDRTLPEGAYADPGVALAAGANGRNAMAEPASPSPRGGTTNLGSSSGPQSRRESGAGPDGTMQGQLLGTPAYMAPEQARGRQDFVDERTDVYGLGAILYEILTGRPPFIGPKTSEIIHKVCTEAPIPPRQLVTDAPRDLEAICLKALRKRPAERYATVTELGQDIQRAMADEPVQAYAEPWSTRVMRWARRHRMGVSVAAGILVMATIASVVGTVLVSRERNEAQTQGQQARHAVQMLTKVADIGFDDRLDPLQKEFLEDALVYYEQFTSRVAHDPAVQLEHGRVYQQMGDIQRKLGRFPASKHAYLKAVEILRPLAAYHGVGPEPRRALARTRALLADLFVRSGGDKSEAESLYRQALEPQLALVNSPEAAREDQRCLGQTLKSQADLLRLNGQFAESGAVYEKALAALVRAHDADPEQSEVSNELALSTDARGWIYRELGDVQQAEQCYRRAAKLLEGLVKDFPTVSRHRESLAKAYNSLALIEESDGRLADAETHLRDELPIVERLSQDFVDRPEHQRELARTLMNLGNILSTQHRAQDAESVLRRAVDINTVITTANPDDVQIRLDLAKCHNNLGEFLRKRGDNKSAVGSFTAARAINQELVKAFPSQPRYSNALASNLANLALALQAVDPAKVEATYSASLALYEKLVADFPKNVDYRLGLANCLRNQGVVIAAAGKAAQAEGVYKKALATLATEDGKTQLPEWRRTRAGVLINLGELDGQGAEEAYRQSIALSQSLIGRAPPLSVDRHNLAIAQNDLAEFLVEHKRLSEAEPEFTRALANFDKLIAHAPSAIDLQSHFGIVLGLFGKCLDLSGKLNESKTALEQALDHQRQAVRLSKNGPMYRELLGDHMLKLSQIELKLGLYDEAARQVLDVPKTVPTSGRAQACFDAARVLARLVTQVGGDIKLGQADRDRLGRNYLGCTIMLLREAIDTDPKLAEQIVTDTDVKLLESRPDFRTMMNTLVDVSP